MSDDGDEVVHSVAAAVKPTQSPSKWSDPNKATVVQVENGRLMVRATSDKNSDPFSTCTNVVSSIIDNSIATVTITQQIPDKNSGNLNKEQGDILTAEMGIRVEDQISGAQRAGVISSDNDFANQDSNVKEDLGDISAAEMGIREDHFGRPEEEFGASSLEELQEAISRCKDMILETSENCEKRKKLVKKLVQLRFKFQEMQDGPEVVDPDIIVVSGHHFRQRQITTVQRYCEKCSGHIWLVLHTWYQCEVCRFNVHGKCLHYVIRTCAGLQMSENPVYILTICPEVGLAAQKYKCAECSHYLAPKTMAVQPRQCDYNGNYYCPNCHWNSMCVIPARVLHNWDFETRKVCKASRQFLRLMRKKPNLIIKDINPQLFTFVEELSMAKKLREDIIIMKQFFLSCKDALEQRLLLHLSERQHFVDGPDAYSLQDLIDAHSGILLDFLGRVHDIFVKHIKKECQICGGRGFICEICNSDKVIFPFDVASFVCKTCSTVLHSECFYTKGRQCPKCQRLQQKHPSTASVS